MTTLTSIVDKASALVESLTALLDSDVATTLPEAAEALGIAETFAKGVKLLASLLEQLETAIGKLALSLEQLDAFGGLLGLLEPLVGAIGRMFEAAGAPLPGHAGTLPCGLTVSAEIGEGFAYAKRALGVASTIEIRSETLAGLREQIGKLIDQVTALAPQDQGEGP